MTDTTPAPIGADALRHALEIAEAALADIGDADREPGDDVAWCEARAAEALPVVRAALASAAAPKAEPSKSIEAEALEYIFGKHADWQRVVADKLVPPWPLEHHADAMGITRAPKAAPAPAAVAGFGLRTTPDSGECPWGGIYSARADAERDAGAMRSATGRDWEVVALAEIASPTLAPVSGAAHEWRVSPAYGGEICANCGAVKGTRRGNATCGEVAAPTTQAAPQREVFDEDGFRAWFIRNLPDNTIIGNSAWWAGHLAAWVQRFMPAAPAPAAQGDAQQRAMDRTRDLAEQGGRWPSDWIEAYRRGWADAAASAAQGDALDTERLDWLTFNISGKALRDIGVIWSEHGDARRAIDAARAAKEGGA